MTARTSRWSTTPIPTPPWRRLVRGDDAMTIEVVYFDGCPCRLYRTDSGQETLPADEWILAAIR
jgi:regulation of enolase protein 1 (concanavalin A-like superfamily)